MPPLDSLESLLIWMRHKPHMYCRTAGELDAVLWYLHVTWAKFADREQPLRAAMDELLGENRIAGFLSDDQRLEPIDTEGPHTRRVVEFWARVDDQLGCREKTDRW